MTSERYPHIIITPEMIAAANDLVNQVKVNRTIASKIDTLSGILGEFAFAQYFFGDWRKHRVGDNKGEVDFADIEIKTSAFPFSLRLNLLVREDYAKKRKPPFYVQVIIDVASTKADKVEPGTKAFICGFASSTEIDAAPKRDFGSKIGSSGGYQCHHICIADLHAMDEFAEAYTKAHKSAKS